MALAHQTKMTSNVFSVAFPLVKLGHIFPSADGLTNRENILSITPIHPHEMATAAYAMNMNSTLWPQQGRKNRNKPINTINSVQVVELIICKHACIVNEVFATLPEAAT